MAIQRILTRSDIPAYFQRVSLDGVIFILSLRYNRRTDAFYMDIQDEEENDILMGLPVQVDVPMLYRFVKENQPKNDFVPVNSVSDDTTFTRDLLGGDVQLLYNEDDQ